MGRKLPIQDHVWLQRDGTPIRLGDMTDSHIANTIRMLRRSSEKWWAECAAACSYGGNSDSMGSYYADLSANEAGDKALQYDRTIDYFMAELRRRHPDAEIYIRRDGERLSRLRL